MKFEITQRKFIAVELATIVLLACAGRFGYCEKTISGMLREAGDFNKDKPSLIKNIASQNPDIRVRSALFLWKNYPDSKDAAAAVMEKDQNPDVRRRIAQVLAIQDKEPKAIVVLEGLLKRYDVSSAAGASNFLNAASALQEATGKPYGTKEAFAILKAPSTWFEDAKASKHPDLMRDGIKTNAVSLLSENKEMRQNSELRESLRDYCVDVEKQIDTAEGKNRAHWEGRLAGLLDIALRVQLPDLAREFAPAAEKIKGKYNRQQFDRVMKPAFRGS